MASTFELKKRYGTSPGTLQGTMGYMHLTARDAAENTASAYQDSAAQITIPTSGSAYSYEAWFLPTWGGTYNSISAVKVWKSAGSLGTGVTIKAAVQTAYATPVVTVSAIATANVPTVEGSALTPSVQGAAPNNTTQYVIMQMHVASTASPGDVGAQTYTVKWTES